MKSHFALTTLIAATMLAGCGTRVYSGHLAENRYWITGGAPYGWFGGRPSSEAVASKAQDLCPSGYEKLTEREGVFEGRYLRWEVQCRRIEAP